MITIISFLLTANTVHAKTIGTISGSGSLNPNLNTVSESRLSVPSTFNQMISAILGLLTITGALYFLFQIVFAGYTILSAGGDTAKLSQARSQITFGVLGLTIVVAAYMLIALISGLLGISFIFNPLGNSNVFR